MNTGQTRQTTAGAGASTQSEFRFHLCLLVAVVLLVMLFNVVVTCQREYYRYVDQKYDTQSDRSQFERGLYFAEIDELDLSDQQVRQSYSIVQDPPPETELIRYTFPLVMPGVEFHRFYGWTAGHYGGGTMPPLWDPSSSTSIGIRRLSISLTVAAALMIVGFLVLRKRREAKNPANQVPENTVASAPDSQH